MSAGTSTAASSSVAAAAAVVLAVGLSESVRTALALGHVLGMRVP